MRTDASARFEKGLDKNSALVALHRAFELVEQLGAGEIVGGIIDEDYIDKTPKVVDFKPEWINSFLGTNIPESDMIKYLTSLDFIVENGKITVPSFRNDIEGKADIAEEIAEFMAITISHQLPSKVLLNHSSPPIQKFTDKILSTMISLGCYEISTYSFISPRYFD